MRRRDGRRAALLAAQDQHPIGQQHGLLHVVRHQNRCGTGPLLHRVEQVLHPQPGQRVQRGQRFVEQQDAGLPRQGTRQAGALGHAAGDLTRVVAGEFAQADDVEPTLYGRKSFRPLDAARQSEGDVGRQRPPRQQPRFLKHHGAARVDPANRLAVDFDPAPLVVQPGNQPQQRRFAATGRSEQRDHRTRFDLDVDVAQHGVRSERPIDVAKRHTCRRRVGRDHPGSLGIRGSAH